MGRICRDARLTFILLWTLADDEGRLRGNSRMLANLLFPYDKDAASHIDTWLEELEDEFCIVRYQIDADHYLQILNWTKHQRIDKPSPSRILPPPECSRTFANDPGRIKDQGRDQGKEGISTPPTPSRGKKSKLKLSGYDPKAVELALAIKEFWPNREKRSTQPDFKTPVPIIKTPLLVDRLAELLEEGCDSSILEAVARRAVDEWREGNWIKAPQYFFGKAEDAPWRSYYRAHVTNEEQHG
jgi:hypothetical protein